MKPPVIEAIMMGTMTQTIQRGTRLHARPILIWPSPVVNDLTVLSWMRFAIALNSLTLAGGAKGGTAQPAVRVLPAGEVFGALRKRTVSVYSSTPSPRRQPQARQKRMARGITA
jgi:hypothetical protein